jgi:ABC-2 type transport system permease protein
MIGTVLRISWLNLSRDRVAQAMTFLLPLAFFSIFALVFGSQGRREIPPVKLALVDEDGSAASRAFGAALEKESAVSLVTQAKPRGAARNAEERVLDRSRAEALVKDGDVPVALVLPAGFGEGLGRFDSPARATILSDPSNPIAVPLLQGLVQKTAVTAQPDALARGGLALFEKYAGPMTLQQHQVIDGWLARPHAEEAASPAAGMLVATDTVAVVGGESASKGALVSFFAAGLGVMFLLFSSSAAAGTLLEETESGTLDRLLTSPLGMGRLLLGKWLFIALLGSAQLTLMFTWGALAFGLELRPHLVGFAVMTLASAAAAAAFALVLASACRSRAQLSGIATIVILMMSALGGSMFPRFQMTDAMQRLGLLTFNAWALDGYIKVFWRDAPVAELWPQVLALVLMGAAFLFVARQLARRWETV